MLSNPRIIGVVVLSLAAVGCAGVQRADAQVEDLVYQRPIEQVWPQVEGLLRDKGWEVEFRDGYRMASGWRQGSEGARMVPGGNEKMVLERMVAVGTALPDGRCVVRFGRQSRVVKGIETGTNGRSTEKTVLIENRTYNGEQAPEYHHVSQIEEGPTVPAWVRREPELERELLARVSPGVK
jgi:hypothetical protein